MAVEKLETLHNSGDQAPWLTDMGNETETVIARLVTVMNRYAKSYIKRALEGSLIQTGEERQTLAYLLAKLDHYNDIFATDKQSDFEELSEKYLGKSIL